MAFDANEYPPDDCRVEDEMSTGLTNTHITCSLKNNAFFVLHYVVNVALHYYILHRFSRFFLPLELSRTALLGCRFATSRLREAARWQLNYTFTHRKLKPWKIINWLKETSRSSRLSWHLKLVTDSLSLSPGGEGGALPYITYTGMCRPTGSWFWSSWFRMGYPFQRRFLERGIKNCGSRLYLLLKIVADYEEAFIWCISRTKK